MQTYFLSAPAMGITAGAMFGGKALKYGRKKPMILFNIIGIGACICSVFENYYIMLGGKIVFGVAAGVLVTIGPRVIQETVPAQHFDKGFGAMTNVGIDILVLANTVLIMTMPKLDKKKNNKEELEKNQTWKIVYLIPIPLFAMSLLLMLMCVRHESVGHLISKGKKEAAIKALR